jgi:hypothetical protein
MRIGWLPQYGDLTHLHLPEDPLPDGESEAVGFDFALSALATGQQNWAFHAPTLVWCINAHDDQAAGFTVQIWHQLANGPRRLLNRHAPAANVAGSAALPGLLRHPYLFDSGDSITVEVKNLDNSANTSNIQVALFAVRLPAGAGATDEEHAA